eukprot:636237-Pelagomonas_calceolata.AAC.2
MPELDEEKLRHWGALPPEEGKLSPHQEEREQAAREALQFERKPKRTRRGACGVGCGLLSDSEPRGIHRFMPVLILYVTFVPAAEMSMPSRVETLLPNDEKLWWLAIAEVVIPSQMETLLLNDNNLWWLANGWLPRWSYPPGWRRCCPMTKSCGGWLMAGWWMILCTPSGLAKCRPRYGRGVIMVNVHEGRREDGGVAEVL